MTHRHPITALALAFATFGCGSNEEPAAEALPAEPPAPSAAPAAQPATAPADHAAQMGALAPMPAVPAGARVFFQAPADGMTVRGPLADGKIEVPVKMGAEGMAVKPAGPVESGAGHHHIIVDGDAIAREQIVPKDETHLHFGQGQTETTIPLAPGKHKLTLQFADGMHRSYGPDLTATIAITVEAEGAPAPEPEGEAASKAKAKAK